jgi:hypothetical protein
VWIEAVRSKSANQGVDNFRCYEKTQEGLSQMDDQVAEFNDELARRLDSLDRGAYVDPAGARARLQRKSAERRKPRG